MSLFSPWRAVLSNARRSSAEIQAFQLEALRLILGHARSNVPAYRHLYAGLPPSALEPQSLADLGRIPTTDAAWCQRQPEADRLSDLSRRPRLAAFLTSGSSGQPVTVLRTAPESRLLKAFRLRAFFGYGGRVRDRRVSLTYSQAHDALTDMSPNPPPLWQRFGVLRRVAMDCGDPVADLLKQIAALDPDVLTGYGASVARLASDIGTEEGKGIRPRFIMTGGESLSRTMRETIEEAFEVPVYDLYGSTEVNLLAWQCAETGLYHVCDDNVVIELLRDGEPVGEGEEGEAFVTSLHTRAMPFLRYSLGDLAVRGPERCPCGAPWSTIEGVRGRTLEGVVLPDGTFLHHWWAVEPMIEQAPWILSYRIEQSSPGEVIFRIVAQDEPSREQIETVESCGRDTFGDDVDFHLVVVDELPPGPAGKHLRHQGLIRAQ